MNGKDETFELRFDCPQSPGSYNSVTSSSSSDSISIKIGSYPQKGFPLRCKHNMSTLGPTASETMGTNQQKVL